jgi:hypothetical protein
MRTWASNRPARLASASSIDWGWLVVAIGVGRATGQYLQQFAGDVVLDCDGIWILPALGNQVEVFEDDDRRRQHLREVVDDAHAVHGFDDDNRRFAGDIIDETFFQHVAVADRGGEKIELGARLLVRNDVAPGPLGHARRMVRRSRLTSTMRPLNGFDS